MKGVRLTVSPAEDAGLLRGSEATCDRVAALTLRRREEDSVV